MSTISYLPDLPSSAADALIMAGSGPEPSFDAVTQAFLWESYLSLKRSCQRGGLLEFASLGLALPWLFRLTFGTRGLVQPAGNLLHPNIAPEGAICVTVYPGESLVEICQSLHDLFRWRLRQYDERDALNPAACAWGRQHIAEPIDDRPLFGERLTIQWQNLQAEGDADV